jgi:ADP-ribosylglycohydrolase
LATETAAPTHNHPEDSKGAVVTALTIFHLKNGKAKEFIREHQLNEYYPDWANKSYADIHDDYTFYSTCAGTVGPAIICFLDSKDYVDCIKLAISLGGDADTLAAIAGPMAYAYYKKMPDALVYQALKKLPDWMVDVSERFDEVVNSK